MESPSRSHVSSRSSVIVSLFLRLRTPNTKPDYVERWLLCISLTFVIAVAGSTRKHHIVRRVKYNAAILDRRDAVRRIKRYARSIRCSWAQAAHCGSRAYSELGHCSAVSGRLTHAMGQTNCMTCSQSMQLIHSAVLTFTSVVAPQNTVAMGLFTAGMSMFSGSIYLLVLDPQRFKFLGPVTPLGGLCLIGGWVALAVTKRPIVPKFK